MKKIIIVCITFFFASPHMFAQDSLTKSRDSLPVKGLYKNYQEFLSNKPSILIDFSTVLIRTSGEDSTIIGAEYKCPDSLDNFGEIWGFCDGKNTFVRNNTLFTIKYWKTQCSGPNPYFYYFHKNISLLPGIANILATTIAATLPPSCTLMFIDKNGMPQNTFRYKLKDLFRDNPSLLKEFKREDEDLLYDNIIIKYLTRYNNSKIKQ